jgi:hypothetical protein
VLIKSKELAGLCGSDVLTVVRKNNRFYVYSSGDIDSILSELVRQSSSFQRIEAGSNSTV